MTNHILPPVVDVAVDSTIDVMRASDAARRVADLHGFSPIYQAMAAGAAQSLAEWLCRTQRKHTIEVYGIQNETQSGLQIACTLTWLKQINLKQVEAAMHQKLSGLIDEVNFVNDDATILQLTLWRTPEREARTKIKGNT